MMLENNKLLEAGDAIRLASSLTETTFLDVGKALETSIDILARLTRNFETLLAALTDEDLGGALQALGQAAAQVADLGHNHSVDGAGFDRLQIVAESIARRLLKMNKSVQTVDSLAIAAKIATTDILTSGVDFSTFPEQITRTLQMTRASLDGFAAELLPVRDRVAKARAGQLTFEARRQEAACSIPPRLVATVAAIHRQHRQAAQASAAVKRRSERVRQQICSAVMALQIGDSTRQRLEHTAFALGVLRQLRPIVHDGVADGMAARSSEGLPTEAAAIEGPPIEPGDYAALSAAERESFGAATYRLQSAQLTDTARAFDRDVRQITASLNTLSAEARALRDLGASAFRSSERGDSKFIQELEGEIGEALELLEDFGAAQSAAAHVMRSVSDSTKGLCGHLTEVQSLEADIRIMSLNTTLKCSRVGREGLALSLIAQELRTYANEFAKEADALMNEVESCGRITVLLTNDNDAGAAPMIAGVMRTMERAFATLRQVGQTLGDTLAELERDSDRVVTLLGETVADLGRHDEIARALRRAAGILAELSPTSVPGVTDLAPQVEQMLDRVAAGYTMETERIIHDRVLGRSGRVAPVAAAAEEMEDLLF